MITGGNGDDGDGGDSGGDDGGDGVDGGKDDDGAGGGVHSSVGFQSWHLITVIRNAARASTIMLASCCIFDENKPKNVSKANIATNFAKQYVNRVINRDYPLSKELWRKNGKL